MSVILGEEIVNIRKMKKLTQKKLCSGICSQGTISLIEKGEVVPGIEILTALALRLNVPVTHFINLIQSETIYLKYDLISEIESLMEEQKYEKIYKIAQTKIKNQELSGWYFYYFKWLYYLSGYYTKKYSAEVVLKAMKTLYTTASEFELNKDYLSDRIVNTIAILYAFEKDYKKALFYFNKIDLKFKNRVEVFEFNKIQLRILYNKVKTLFDMREIEQTIATCNLGVEQSIKTENMSLIGNFYYYLGKAHEEFLSSKEEISLYYKRALHFFEVLNKDLYIEILKNKQQKYLVEDC